MHFNKLFEIINDNLEAGISTELKSGPGVGKSEFVESLVKRLSARDGFEWGFFPLFLATYTPQDLMGYMVPTKDAVSGALHSTFTTPPWMIDAQGRHINSFERAIVFLDEYGQGDADTKRVSAQLLLKGEVGPHRLKPGVGVIAASNRASDRSGVTKDFDFVINRRMEIAVQPDIESWNEWASQNGVSPVTQAFANQNVGIVFGGDVPEKQGPWCTPRSLVLADKFLAKKAARTGSAALDDSATMEALGGIIGAAGVQYGVFLKLAREMPKYEDIVKDPVGTKVSTKPDAMMLICYNLAHRVLPEHADAVIKYVERMPKEFSTTFCTAATRRNPQLTRTPAIQAWVKANSSLMAAVVTSASNVR